MNQLMTELGQVYYQYRPAGPQQPTLMCLPAFGWTPLIIILSI